MSMYKGIQFYVNKTKVYVVLLSSTRVCVELEHKKSSIILDCRDYVELRGELNKVGFNKYFIERVILGLENITK